MRCVCCAGESRMELGAQWGCSGRFEYVINSLLLLFATPLLVLWIYYCGRYQILLIKIFDYYYCSRTRQTCETQSAQQCGTIVCYLFIEAATILPGYSLHEQHYIPQRRRHASE